MLNFFRQIIGGARSDAAVEHVWRTFKGKVLAEPMATKLNRHRVFWVGRSEVDGGIRVGIEFNGKTQCFYDISIFDDETSRISEFLLVTPDQADALEADIVRKTLEAKEARKHHRINNPNISKGA